MEPNSPAVAYMPLTRPSDNDTGAGPPDRRLVSLGEVEQGTSFAGKRDLMLERSGSDTRSSTDDSTSSGSTINQSTSSGSSGSSEIALHGSSPSLEEFVVEKDFRRHGHDHRRNQHGKNYTQYFDHRNLRYRHQRSEYEMNRTLWVGNVPVWASNEQVAKLFSKAGEITHIYMPKKPTKKDTSKFAFIGYRKEESVPRALEELHGATLFGKVLKLAARHGSRHEAQAAELEKKLESLARSKSRKEELKKVRELAKQRMEMTSCSSYANRLRASDSDSNHDDEAEQMIQMNSTFQRHALEFQTRHYRYRGQSTVDRPLPYENQGQCSPVNRSKTWISKPKPHSVAPRGGPSTYSFDGTNCAIDYQQLKSPSYSSTPLTPYKRHDSFKSPKTPKSGGSNGIDIRDSSRRPRARTTYHGRGPSYYNNESIVNRRTGKTDEERREREYYNGHKRRLDYDVDRDCDYHHRRRAKEGRYSDDKSSRSTRKTVHDEHKSYKRGRTSNARSRSPRKNSQRREKSRDRHRRHEPNDRRRSTRSRKSLEGERHASGTESQSEQSNFTVPSSKASTSFSSAVSCNEQRKRKSMEVAEFGDSDGSCGDASVLSISGKNGSNGSACEVAPGSYKSSSSLGSAASPAHPASPIQMRPEDLARLILSNIDSLNTVAAPMGFQVTPSPNVSQQFVEIDVDQGSALASQPEAKTKKKKLEKEKTEVTGDDKSKTICRIM